MFLVGGHPALRTKVAGSAAAVGLVAGLLVSTSQSQALASDVIGGVRTVTGTATLLREGEEVPVALGDPVELMDELRTGPGSTLGVILDDETRLSMGPDSVLVVDDMVYAPAAGDAALSINLLNGTLSYISGAIAQVRPDAVRLTTPNATIGIRGTRIAIRAPAK